jgi:hypothetical protein
LRIYPAVAVRPPFDYEASAAADALIDMQA